MATAMVEADPYFDSVGNLLKSALAARVLPPRTLLISGTSAAKDYMVVNPSDASPSTERASVHVTFLRLTQTATAIFTQYDAYTAPGKKSRSTQVKLTYGVNNLTGISAAIATFLSTGVFPTSSN